MAILYIFGGLPGAGKSELARHLAARRGAVYLRIDTIEQTLRDKGLVDLTDEGYLVAYQLAADNLRLGQSVVADSVNPVLVTREAWRRTAAAAGASFCEIEIVCSDKAEHRFRVEGRKPDIAGLRPPAWASVLQRQYEDWSGSPLRIDTAGKTPAESKNELEKALHSLAGC